MCTDLPSLTLPSCLLSSQIGLLVACYQGYVDVVIALSQCPHLDVNWQDSEGNTALITAAQAGSVHTPMDTQQHSQRLRLTGSLTHVHTDVVDAQAGAGM